VKYSYPTEPHAERENIYFHAHKQREVLELTKDLRLKDEAKNPWP
jgi:hypothetical protein